MMNTYRFHPFYTCNCNLMKIDGQLLQSIYLLMKKRLKCKTQKNAIVNKCLSLFPAYKTVLW